VAKPSENVMQTKRRRTGVVAFFVESVHELKRVRWPKRQEVVNFTTAALLVCFVMGLLVWAFDLGVNWVMTRIGIL
jgi:preprotein translocase subunit SecE